MNLVLMKVLSYILLLGLLVAHVSCNDDETIDDPCAEQKIVDCVHTEVAPYMKCIEEKKEMRSKRQAQCPYAVPYGQQQPVVHYPVQPQQMAQQPHYHIPTVQPNAAINNPDQGMFTENVEYIPQNQIGHRTIIVQDTNKNGTTNKFTNQLPVAGHNITTVINLKNIINNTNNIDMPTNINNTNIHNIHIYHNKTSTTGGKFDLGYTEKGSCCFSVRPKTCRKTSNGPKCHHHRHKTCGPSCTSRIIHAQVRRRCSYGDCYRRTVHIPQPPRPRCISTYNWPYVSCGGYQQSWCHGCYDHYGYGYENYYGPGYGNDRCNGCYDDGFEYGPMYRRGPVLRPFHYHEPPCEISATCDGSYYEDDNGYFGHDRIDPAFHEDDSGLVNDDDRYFSDVFNISDSSAADDGLDEESGDGDWAIETRQCRVVDESDGSIQIRNCTVDDLDNQYARSPQGNANQENIRQNTRRPSPYYNYPAPYMAAPPFQYMSPYMLPYMMPPVQYMPPQGQYRRPSEFDEDYGEEDHDEIRYRRRSPKHNGKQHNKYQHLPVDEEDLDAFKDDDREFDVYEPKNLDQ